jgi:microcystin-dependent protein
MIELQSRQVHFPGHSATGFELNDEFDRVDINFSAVAARIAERDMDILSSGVLVGFSAQVVGSAVEITTTNNIAYDSSDSRIVGPAGLLNPPEGDSTLVVHWQDGYAFRPAGADDIALYTVRNTAGAVEILADLRQYRQLTSSIIAYEISARTAGDTTNSNSISAETAARISADNNLQAQITALAGGISIVPHEVKHCTGLNISAWSGLTHVMDLGQNVTFSDGDLVASSFDMKIYTAHAGAWTLLQVIANHDAFFIIDNRIYFNTSPEGAVDFLYNNAGTFVTLFDMPSLAQHANSHASGGGDPITPAMIGASPAGVVPVGSLFDYTGLTPPAGFILASGLTIGDAASGATERANADTFDLFSLYWGYADAVLPLQDLNGATVQRSSYVDAPTAFGVHCRMTVPDLRGRATIGRDNMGGTAAGRITTGGSGISGTALLESGGVEAQTLTTNQMPTHTHIQNAHNHTQDAHAHAGSTAASAGSHSHVVNAHNHGGGGHAHDITVYTNQTGGSTVAVTRTSTASGVASAIATQSSGTIITSQSPGTDTEPNHTHSLTIASATAVNNNTTATNQNTGGGAAHLNVQPSIVVLKIIKL